MSIIGREALPDVRERLGSLPGCPGVIGSPPESLLVVGMPSRMSRSGWEDLTDVY